MTYSEWRKKKREEEEKAALTAQEKAMGGINNASDNIALTSSQFVTFEEWQKNKNGEKDEEESTVVADDSPKTFAEWAKMMSDEDAAQGQILKKPNTTKVDSYEEWRKMKRAEANGETYSRGGNKDAILKSGGFDDGVDGVKDFFGDLFETTAGTLGDAILGIVHGARSGIEGIEDELKYVAAGISDLAGNDAHAERLRTEARRNTVEEEYGWMRNSFDDTSVLGNPADTLMEIGGQQIPTLMAGPYGLIVTGVSAAGNATSAAYADIEAMGDAYTGNKDLHAFLYGAGSGVAAALTESITGGLGKGVKALGISRGIGGLDDIVAKKISNAVTKAITNETAQKVLGNTLEAAVKAGGEGLEEVAEGILSAVMKKFTYASNEEWSKLIADEKLLEQFAYGAAFSAIMQGADVVKSTANKTDYVTGMTSAEEKVINKAAEQEIAKREANGEKLTKKDKNEVYNRFTEDISKGYISIDTIEETLGGDKYTEYKKAVDENDALKKELDELRKMESGKMNDIQRERLTELKAMNLDDTSKIDEMKKQMSDDVLKLVKSDRKGKGSLLMESYNEKTRLGQGFVANYDSIKGKKYEDAARQTIDNAIKAGANNSNRVHDLVDMAAKLSSETGIVYKFGGNDAVKADFIQLQNERLAKLEAIENPNETQLKEIDKIKELIRKVESGETKVNGNFTGKGIMLNLDSPKLLNTVVGHEMTHTLEQTKHYEALQKALFTYAKTKGVDIDAKVAELTELYKGVEGADAKAELTADLIGDYLFNDYDFVKTLAKDRNVFQRMWDRVKYLGKLATAGSKEARELARVERMFAKAYQEVTKNTTNEGGVKYSMRETTDGRFVAVVDNDILANLDTTSWDKNKKDEARSAAKQALAQFGDGIAVNGINHKVNRTTKREYTRANDSEHLYKKQPDIFADKMRAADVADDILMATTNWQKDGRLVHPRKDNFVDFVHGDTLIMSGNAKYSAEVVVGITSDGESVFYDVVDMTPTSFDLKNKESSTTATTQDAIGDISEDSSKPIIAQNSEKSSSLENLSDSDGNPIDIARISSDESDTSYSLSHNSEIAEGQSKYIVDHKAFVTESELAEAQRVTNAMVDVMMKYSNILPEDKIGKVLTKNGSYDRSVENTTICVRTLAYNEFVDKVQEEIGRPLTQMESFLVSQKLYDIATDPQCMYCYVSLDRKAFNDMLLRYMQDRDTVIDKYNKSDKTPAAIDALYEEFLHGRKPTAEMRTRFDEWISYADNGTQMLSLADIATEDRQSVIKANGGNLADQLADARKYAQAASWSKIQKNYVAYRDEILKLGDRVVKNLNEHYGLRWYSFSDYSAAFIVENMQQITDASIRGLKGLAYTKDTDFAEIFAPSGMNINVSVFVSQDENGNFYIDEKQSADFEKALELRDRYPNVGIVATVTNDEALRWAGSQEWSDVIIPFHIVRTGADVAEYYKWLNYTAESADTIGDKDLWNAYLDSLNKTTETARKRVSKNVYPNEHHNDKNTYLNLCESRGLTPRFARFAGEDWYMKLVNETRLSADESSPLKPTYNEEAAKASFQKFVDKGGYEGGWYKEGVDVDSEAKAVAEDVLAGKKANEVNYGRQDIAPESLIASRKTNRTHGQHSLSTENVTNPIGHRGILGSQFRVQEDIAPLTMDNAEAPTSLNGVDNTVGGVDSNQTVSERIAAQIENLRTEMDNDIKHRENAIEDFDISIAMAQAEYDALKNKTTRKANDILRRIERLERLKSNVDADFQNRIDNLQKRIDKLGTVEYKRAEQRRAKQQTYTEETSELMGDTSTWRDKKLGISYQTNTLRRNLRDIVRDANGNKDIARADRIYDYLQGTYNHNEAKLKQESRNIKKPFADMKINKYESTYAQMLGELRHNPETILTKSEVDKYLQKHKGKIDTDKVDKIISEARKVYDDLIKRVNEVLRQQGMREIAYRKGYFPHFTEDKQSFLGKLFNWKTKNDDIPTDIAGLTETFEPVRSYQSFNKQRTTDKTDYNFKKGFDTYVHGALDWIYHIEDIQKRRAFENEIRYRHSEQGVQNKIDEIKANTEYDADEAQRQIDSVFEEARNPLNNFVTDFRRATQTLAGKKSSADREMEYSTNRKIYSTMTNISNRVSANMVAGSISSALTNFIPITQSWSQVSPIRTIQAMRDTIRNYVRDDGTIMESDFLTNRLMPEENLDKTTWDKIGEKVGGLMEVVDNFTSQVVWRSKYLDNIKKGMTESQAIANADAFAEGIMAGRSRGNMPTIFDSKNPITKMLTAFQLEVANQYGYMFKDMPNEIGTKNIGKLVNGYAGMFIGAYVYNALYSALTGRDAAFDPIGILEDLLRDLGFGDDDEEEVDVFGAVSNLAENVAQEIPFVGGLLGGGRVPISSALPYDMDFSEAWTDIEGMVTAEDNDKYTESFIKEMLKPVWYLGLPMGGGQIKKTIEGLSMFSDDHPVAGSYTDSGNLRYPVEDTIGNRIQAALFGQYANENARYYFDNDLAPLKENQIQEYIDVGMPIEDYWDYREGLSKLKTNAEKIDYIDSLDLTAEQKNILANNILDRETPVDMTDYGDYSSLEEFDFAYKYPEKYEIAQTVGGYDKYVEYQEGMKGMKLAEKVDYVASLDLTTEQKNALINGETDRKEPIDLTGYENYSSFEEFEYAKNNPQKYSIAKAVGGYDTYMGYSDALNDIKADKDSNGKTISGSRKEKVLQYIESLDIPYGEKIILFRSEYNADDTYNYDIVRYLEAKEDMTYEEKLETLKALGMTVDKNGNIYW